MKNPFKYRPLDPDEIDWEDNPLSNFLAWASDILLPKACSTPGTIMSRISNYMWTSCSCCLFWRGAVMGVAGGAFLSYVFNGALTLINP